MNIGHDSTDAAKTLQFQMPYMVAMQSIYRRMFVRIFLTLPLAALGCGQPPPTIAPERVALLSALADQVSGDRAMGHVLSLVAEHQADTPLDCSQWDASYEPDCSLTRDRSRAWLVGRLSELGLEVSTQEVEDGVFSTSNVVADLPGTSRPDEIVWVGAHFDAFYAGADDNSSGVAALVELATVLSGHSFARTLRFIGFDLEEFGLVGSSRYVLAEPDENLLAGIVFDCIAYYDETPGSQQALPGLQMPDTGDFLGVVANDDSTQLALDVFALSGALQTVQVLEVVAPSDGAYALTGNLLRSDHAPFWLEGDPTLFFTDTANFRNPHYHTPQDVPDTLSTDFLEQVIRLSVASLAWWAEVNP